MSISSELSSLVTVQDPQAREIIPPPGGYSDFQKQLIKYRECYRSKLLDDECRRTTWGERYDDLGRRIDRKNWKPLVRPAIGKILVHTQHAYLVGADKFPAISLVTQDEEPFPGLPPLEKVDDPALAASMAQKRALQTFLDELMKSARLKDAIEDAVLEALILKDQPLILRFYDGLPYYTVPDRLWCDWGFQKRRPRELEWFEERYFFKRKVGKQDKTFYYLRHIDTTDWKVWEVEINDETKLNDEGELDLGEPIESFAHGFGFVPVSLFSFKSSIFADEMVENIKGYIEYRNDLMAGVSGNMDPQRTLLTKPGGPRPMGRPGDEEKAPLERGALWELEGDSIQSFSNDTEGYKVAQTDLADAKDDLYQAARILMIPADNEQSGKALAIRSGPQISETMRLRTDVGYGMVDSVDKLVKGSAKVKLKVDVEAPPALTQFTVQLDWGQLLPMTPEDIQTELENAQNASGGTGGKQLLSERTAKRYIGPYFNVEDQAEEDEQIEKEQAAAQQQQLDLQSAAFESSNKPPEGKQDKEDEEDG